MWCRSSKSAQGDGKFAAAKVATPLQYASAGDSPPTTLPLPLHMSSRLIWIAAFVLINFGITNHFGIKGRYKMMSRSFRTVADAVRVECAMHVAIEGVGIDSPPPAPAHGRAAAQPVY